MAKEQKKMVDDITSMDEDFAKWYTDICKKDSLFANKFFCIKFILIFRLFLSKYYIYICKRLVYNIFA